jgi:hypothetical protein
MKDPTWKISNEKENKKRWDMAQMDLPGKHEALSSTLHYHQKKKKKVS